MAKLHKSKLNMLTTLMRQLIATICGIVLPRVLIGAFGSVVYGATTSIAQFLSYISLLEGGIGRVARGALYQPLAQGDKVQVSRIHQAIRRFFLNIAAVFLVYTLVLAFFYKDIADIATFDRSFVFGLVVAISLSTMANYLGGMENTASVEVTGGEGVAAITNVTGEDLPLVRVFFRPTDETGTMIGGLCRSFMADGIPAGETLEIEAEGWADGCAVSTVLVINE